MFSNICKNKPWSCHRLFVNAKKTEPLASRCKLLCLPSFNLLTGCLSWSFFNGAVLGCQDKSIATWKMKQSNHSWHCPKRCNLGSGSLSAGDQSWPGWPSRSCTTLAACSHLKGGQLAKLPSGCQTTKRHWPTATGWCAHHAFEWQPSQETLNPLSPVWTGENIHSSWMGFLPRRLYAPPPWLPYSAAMQMCRDTNRELICSER